MCTHVLPACISGQHVCAIREGQRMNLESEMAVSHCVGVGIKPVSSGRTASALSHLSHLSSPHLYEFNQMLQNARIFYSIV